MFTEIFGNIFILVEGCKDLEEIDHGWVMQDPMSTIGSIATYSCQTGYFLAGRSERRCEEGGLWSGVPPSCEKGSNLVPANSILDAGKVVVFI